MRRLFPFLIILALANCTTPPGTGLSVIDQIRGQALAICKFVPAIDTVTAILTQVSGVANVVAIAQAICDAVKQTPPLAPGARAAPGRPRPIVNNVEVRGVFVE